MARICGAWGLLLLIPVLAASPAVASSGVYENAADEIVSIPEDNLIIVGRVVHMENTADFLAGGPLPNITFAVLRTLRGAAADTITGLGYNTFFRPASGEWLTKAVTGAPWLLPDDVAFVALQEFTREVDGQKRTLNRIRTVYFLDGEDLRDESPLYRNSTLADGRDRPLPDTDDLEVLLRAFKSPPSRPAGITLGQAGELVGCPLPRIRDAYAPAATGEPRFAFYGNLPEAVPERDPDPAHQHPPAPVPQDDVKATWHAQPGEPLFLVRDGRIVAAGQVGAIHRGWWPRAGGDRIAYFQTVGLPDSLATIIPAEDNFFPRSNDGGYDLQVIGRQRLAIVVPDTATVPTDFDLHAAVCGLEPGRVLDPRAYPELCSQDTSGRIVPPATATLVDHLAGEGAFSVLDAASSSGRRVRILRCTPTPDSAAGAFSVLYAADGRRAGAIKGTLDVILDLDGWFYLVAREAQWGSGLWRYRVYRLDDFGEPRLVYTDSSWST